MAMTNPITVENSMPEFRSTFSSLIDEDGYLINQENLNCREITGKSLLVLRLRFFLHYPVTIQQHNAKMNA